MAMRVNSAPLNEMCRRIDAEFDAMERSLERLRTQAAALESQWNGEAREAFHRSYAAAQSSLSAMRALGSGITVQVREHVEDIGAVDRRRATAWRR